VSAGAIPEIDFGPLPIPFGFAWQNILAFPATCLRFNIFLAAGPAVNGF
jgi:hypothetical protein